MKKLIKLIILAIILFLLCCCNTDNTSKEIKAYKAYFHASEAILQTLEDKYNYLDSGVCEADYDSYIEARNHVEQLNK